jgi:hypothetical protein
MRVFIDIPPHIGIEVIEQSLDRREGIALLKVSVMPVVPFPRLIVISENTNPSVDQIQPVFEECWLRGIIRGSRHITISAKSPRRYTAPRRTSSFACMSA